LPDPVEIPSSWV